MKIQEIIKKTLKELSELTGFPAFSGIGARKEGENWIVTVEMLEKKSIPDGMDILGIYEVKTDPGGDVIEYQRKRTRRRMDAENVAGAGK